MESRRVLLAQTVHLPDCYGWIALRVGTDVPAAVAHALTPGMTVFVHRDLDLAVYAVYAVQTDRRDPIFRDARAPVPAIAEAIAPLISPLLSLAEQRACEGAVAVLGRLVREGVWGTTCVVRGTGSRGDRRQAHA